MTATAAPQRSNATTPALSAAVVPLLAIAVFINYVDRGNLATAAPLVKNELHLTNTQFGLMISAFFWTYVPAQIFAAWLAERINAYRVLAIGLAIWSIATALSGLAGGFASLFALRLALGVGEAASFPCSSKLIGQHLPQAKLGLANGMLSAGLALGPAVGTFTGGLLMAQFGWRAVFLIFGMVSLLWLVPWQVATHRASARAEPPPSDAPSFWTILSRSDAWGACLGHFCNAFALYFLLSWLPLYLVQARGFTVARMAEIGGLIYLIYAISCVATGAVSDWLMRRGADATIVRKTAMGANAIFTCLSLVAAAFGDATVTLIALFCAGAAFGLATPTLYSIGQTLAGPRVAGKWVGLQNSLGNLAGIVAPVLTGWAIDITGNFVGGFVIAGAVGLMGFVAWVLIVGRVASIDWSQSRQA